MFDPAKSLWKHYQDKVEYHVLGMEEAARSVPVSHLAFEHHSEQADGFLELMGGLLYTMRYAIG